LLALLKCPLSCEDNGLHKKEKKGAYFLDEETYLLGHSFFLLVFNERKNYTVTLDQLYVKVSCIITNESGVVVKNKIRICKYQEIINRSFQSFGRNFSIKN
jgi:hypothetical protein